MLDSSGLWGSPGIKAHFHTTENSSPGENGYFEGWTLWHCTPWRSLSSPKPISPGVSQHLHPPPVCVHVWGSGWGTSIPTPALQSLHQGSAISSPPRHMLRSAGSSLKPFSIWKHFILIHTLGPSSCLLWLGKESSSPTPATQNHCNQGF